MAVDPENAAFVQLRGENVNFTAAALDRGILRKNELGLCGATPPAPLFTTTFLYLATLGGSGVPEQDA